MLCPKCNHYNPRGRKVCAKCYAPLPRREAKGVDSALLAPMTGIPVGEVLCVVLSLVLLALLPKLRPSAADIRVLLLQFGLMGMVTLGALFALLKGHFDLSCGPVAGVAACAAIIASGAGALQAVGAGVVVGAIAGCLNGLIVGWTRVPSLLFTVAMGAVGTHLALHISATRELQVTDALFESLGSATFLGAPTALLLLLAAMLGAYLLLKRPTFLPVGGAPDRAEAAVRGDSEKALAAFGVSGVMAGLAGVFIAAAQLPVTAPTGQTTWLLAPVAALLLGGASGSAGRGSIRIAVSGAACLALINWFLGQLRTPISGPVCEALIIAAALLMERWRMLGWYQLHQLRRGNLFALPEELRLPSVLPVFSRVSKPALVGLSLTLSVTAYAYIGFYATRHVPTRSAVVASRLGLLQVYRTGGGDWEDCALGDVLHVGDTVRTGVASKAMLRFSDGSYVRLYAGTSLYMQQLEETGLGRNTRLYMQAGRLWASVHRLVSPVSSFEVDSPALTVGVRGTIFLVVVQFDEAYVEVAEGSVSVVRKYAERDRRTGALATREQSDVLQMGEWIGNLRDHRVETPQQLPNDELEALKVAGEKVVAQLRRTLLDPGFWRGLLALVISLVVLLLLFAFLQPPAPPTSTFDMADRAGELEGRRQRTREDSPNAASLAQLHLNMGQIDEARAELQSIVQVDPDSEYGQWAQRVLVRLRSPEQPQADQEDEGDA